MVKGLICLAIFVSSLHAFAVSAPRGGGAVSSLTGYGSVGLYGGIVNASQNDLNLLQQRANLHQGGITTGQLTQAWELSTFYQYRFSGTMYAIHIRPSYFYQREDGGSASAGQFTYAVTGWSIFPMLRLYPLENDFMKLYLQFGLGYGSATGQISEGAGNTVRFGSSSFGTQVGLGVEFCFTGTQCVAVEGNYRYLNFDRNIVTSSSGSFNSANGSLSQYGNHQEIELDNNDLSIRMGGLLFQAGYVYYF